MAIILPQHIARIATLAAMGNTMAEIQEDTGITDERELRAVMEQCNIRLRSGGAGIRFIPIRISARTYEALRACADSRSMVGGERAAWMLERVADQLTITLVDNLVSDNIKTPETK